MDNDKNSGMSLYEAEKKRPLEVVAVPEVAQLHNLGLRVGTRLAVENRYRLGGPVWLRVEDAYGVAVGADVARHITVKEVTPR